MHKYLLALVLFTVPLYPKFPLLTIRGSQVAIRFEDFIVLFVFIFWFLGNATNWRNFVKDPTRRAVLIFWGIGFLSLISASYLTQTVAISTAVLHWARRVEYMLFFVMALDARTSKADIYFYLRSLAVITAYVFVDGIGQRYFNWPVITTQNSEYSKGLALQFMPGGHLVSTFAGHYDMASFFILFTPILLTFAFYKKPSFRDSITILGACVMGVWLVANAASRVSIFSYAGAISLSLLVARRAKFIPIVLGVIFVFSITSMSLIGRYQNILDVVIKKVSAAEIMQEPIFSTPEPTPTPPIEDRSTNIRLDVEWPRALRALTKNPFLGTGYSSITLATDNDYLRSLGEVGTLGSLSFLLVLFQIFREVLENIIKRKKWNSEKLLAVGLLGGSAGLFVNMVFIDILEASKIAICFWLILGITISHLRYSKK